MQKLENTLYQLNGDEVLLSQIESGGTLPPKKGAEIKEGYWVVVDVQDVMDPADFEKTMQEYGIDFVDTTENISSNS